MYRAFNLRSSFSGLYGAFPFLSILGRGGVWFVREHCNVFSKTSVGSACPYRTERCDLLLFVPPHSLFWAVAMYAHCEALTLASTLNFWASIVAELDRIVRLCCVYGKEKKK